MITIPTPTTRRVPKTDGLPSYVFHPSFKERKAEYLFDPEPLLTDPINYDDCYMPDDVTRDHARRMHHAAHRMHQARTRSDCTRWQRDYFTLRDRIVLGNRKLVYRAVRRRAMGVHQPDDMIGDCQIVLIQAVAVFNPWMGIRFSTYAYTCLLRALSRSARRLTTDWLARSLSLDALPDGEPSSGFAPEPHGAGQIRIDEYLRDDHPLLTDREKAVITRRFCLGEASKEQTLEKVGRSIGLSKERVRQVQAIALGKLRHAIVAPPA